MNLRPCQAFAIVARERRTIEPTRAAETCCTTPKQAKGRAWGNRDSFKCPDVPIPPIPNISQVFGEHEKMFTPAGGHKT